MERKRRFSIDIRSWRLSRKHLAKKVQLSLIWSLPHRALPWSPQRGLKSAQRPFSA